MVLQGGAVTLPVVQDTDVMWILEHLVSSIKSMGVGDLVIVPMGWGSDGTSL